jgi:hypothetical protein
MEGQRPSISSVFTNLQAPMPWRRKVRLLVRNIWIRLRTGSNCCGHYGEPGC